LGFKISAGLEPLIEKETGYMMRVTSAARTMDKGK